MKLIIVPVTAGILTLTMLAPLIIKDCILAYRRMTGREEKP
jgi:hypothetical protein